MQGIPEDLTPVFYGEVTEIEPKQSYPTVQLFNLEDDLRSEKGIDYSYLRDLLKAGKWQEADDVTLNLMLQIARRKKYGWLGVPDIQKLPHIDLRTIDALWIKYSQGKFGFSVQKKIYLADCDRADRRYMYYNDDCWKKFGDAVGWRINENWIWHSEANFNISAPQGHLPIVFPKFSDPYAQGRMIGMLKAYYDSSDNVFYVSPHIFPLLSRSDF